MYDRYDSSKGRYVTYEYRPKGDRFSRGLSPIPRVYSIISRSDTGHTFKRRILTNEAKQLTVGMLKSWVRPEVAADLEDHTLYFLEVKGAIYVSEKPIPASPGTLGFPVRFVMTEQYKGRRHWFVCVGCGRRVGKLYLVTTTQGTTWGCQKCLGLSYSSQAHHKTHARDMAILEARVSAGEGEWEGARWRMRKRVHKMERRMGALLISHA